MKLSLFVFCLATVLCQRNNSAPVPITTEPAPIAKTSVAPATTVIAAPSSEIIQPKTSVPIVETVTTSPTPSASGNDTQEKTSTSTKAVLITGIVVGSAIFIAAICIFAFRKFGVRPSNNFKNRLRQSFTPANHSAETTAVANAPFARKPSPTSGGFATYETNEVVPIEPVAAAHAPQQYYDNAGYPQQYYSDQNGYEYGYNGHSSEVGYQQSYAGAQGYADPHSQVGYDHEYDPHSQAVYDQAPPVPHKY